MSQPYLGEIRLFGFGRVPQGWFACNGQLVSIAENEALFMLLGTTYGGDGVTTFGVPDLQGRVPVHQGQGPGLANYLLGQRAGTESVTLSGLQIPQHTHTLVATTLTATAKTPAATLELGALNGDVLYVTDTSGAVAFAADARSVSAVGGNQPHENQMPTLTVQYCIAQYGVFPSQG
ncbi:phage tail protein [Lysobacter enzymogenes]|uniref:Microcystin dependent protein n=1 Tax=Lysobacter enzymogenes TaxID=69 RepID=A0AAU9AVP0_LYSEN|nr:tail fiber protein [Lysobacter enzymogenes]BAV98416.1 microcystin dependent protein [Lysobacter enzymogenes]